MDKLKDAQKININWSTINIDFNTQIKPILYKKTFDKDDIHKNAKEKQNIKHETVIIKRVTKIIRRKNTSNSRCKDFFFIQASKTFQRRFFLIFSKLYYNGYFKGLFHGH